MLMIGTNNTGGASGPEIAEGIGALVLELRKDFPDAKILLLAIFPRGAGPLDPNRRKCEEANQIIARLDDQNHMFFMNINSKFLDDKGGLIGFRPTDHLHPVEQGYEILGVHRRPDSQKLGQAAACVGQGRGRIGAGNFRRRVDRLPGHPVRRAASRRPPLAGPPARR